jgi:hypothetical protein
MTLELAAITSDTAWDVLIVSVGAVVAVLVGGLAITKLLAPFTAQLEQRPESTTLARAGRYIGWLERALLYAFVLTGVPGAAAAVVALKSVARFPSFSEERFAEYYLIGTLASVLVATCTAMAVRAALDLSPLLA